MANSRKPAKGTSGSADKTNGKSADKPIEDAVVIDEKSTAAPAKEPGKKSVAAKAGGKDASTAKTAVKGAAKDAQAAGAKGKDEVKPAKSAEPKPATKPSDAPKDAKAKPAEKAADSKATTGIPAVKGSTQSKTPPKSQDKAQDAAKPDAKAATGEPAKDAPAKTAAKPAAKPTPTPAPTSATAKRASVMPMLLGGAIAAAIGFGAARYPDQWPFVTGPVEDPMATQLAAQAEQIAAMEAAGKQQADALAALKADDSLNVARGEISGEFAQLRTQLEAMSGTLDDLQNRLHTVEKLPQGSGMEAAAAAASAYERELQQMRQMLDAELAKITTAKDDAATLEQSAAEAAKAAGARAALARVLAALDTGRPYGDALFDLTQQAGVDAPAALSDYAENGVPTLVALQASFPAAARAALDASVRDAVAAGEMDRVSAFFRLQLGSRSLTPKEGSDPDAILSRAEAALKTGQLGDALSELSALPEAGQPALGGWIASATARKDALAAGDALAQLVNSK